MRNVAASFHEAERSAPTINSLLVIAAGGSFASRSGGDDVLVSDSPAGNDLLDGLQPGPELAEETAACMATR